MTTLFPLSQPAGRQQFFPCRASRQNCGCPSKTTEFCTYAAFRSNDFTSPPHMRPDDDLVHRQGSKLPGNIESYTMPAPLIAFTQFAHSQWWWLWRGPPPWLEDSPWWARALRLSLVLGFTGAVAAGLTAVMLNTTEGYSALTGLSLNTIQLFGPGLWFGVGTLVPLSRWLGRGWIMTLMSVPVAMFSHFCAFMAVWIALVPSGPHPPRYPELGCFCPGFVAALIVALWMGHPLRKTAWLAAAIAMVMGSIGSGIVLLAETQRLPRLASLGFGENVFAAFCLYASFQSLAAIGLGARLWWPGDKGTDDHSEKVTKSCL